MLVVPSVTGTAATFGLARPCCRVSGSHRVSMTGGGPGRGGAGGAVGKEVDAGGGANADGGGAEGAAAAAEYPCKACAQSGGTSGTSLDHSFSDSACFLPCGFALRADSMLNADARQRGRKERAP